MIRVVISHSKAALAQARAWYNPDGMFTIALRRAFCVCLINNRLPINHQNSQSSHNNRHNRPRPEATHHQAIPSRALCRRAICRPPAMVRRCHRRAMVRSNHQQDTPPIRSSRQRDTPPIRSNHRQQDIPPIHKAPTIPNNSMRPCHHREITRRRPPCLGNHGRSSHQRRARCCKRGSRWLRSSRAKTSPPGRKPAKRAGPPGPSWFRLF